MKWSDMSPRERDAGCEVCGGPVPPQNTHWCSMSCRREAQTVEITCEQCGARRRVKRSGVERGQFKYCSPQCAQVASRRHEPVDYKGVRFYLNVGGYYESQDGQLLHRVVWESCWGPIPDGHVIHHIDGDPNNNELKNLKCMERGEHTAMHNTTGVEMGSVTCNECGKVVSRRMSDIRRGQDKFCSRKCSNRHRAALRAKGVEV